MDGGGSPISGFHAQQHPRIRGPSVAVGSESGGCPSRYTGQDGDQLRRQVSMCLQLGRMPGSVSPCLWSIAAGNRDAVLCSKVASRLIAHRRGDKVTQILGRPHTRALAGCEEVPPPNTPMLTGPVMLIRGCPPLATHSISAELSAGHRNGRPVRRNRFAKLNTWARHEPLKKRHAFEELSTDLREWRRCYGRNPAQFSSTVTTKNPGDHSRTEHIDIQLEYIPTGEIVLVA
ncbi:hypothetical protein F4815DRAFT_500997 [Daldinia loculata]|nr:hypothetical protein F4815DRAFT_500997 [Daldinia loculata]